MRGGKKGADVGRGIVKGGWEGRIAKEGGEGRKEGGVGEYREGGGGD